KEGVKESSRTRSVDGKCQRKRRPPTHLTLHSEATAQDLREPAGNRQPESRAQTGMGVEALERLEDAGLLLRSDSQTVIDHADRHLRIGQVDLYLDRVILRAVPNGV